jgi:integrase
LAIYLDQLARKGAKVSTLRRRLAAINFRLRSEGRPAVSIREEPLASVWRGIARDIGAPPRQARAVEISELRDLALACGDDLTGLRDRALLLLGFAGALRRSELAGLDWSPEGDGIGHIEAAPQGLRLILKRSKTNQTGDREEIAICRGAYAATCPVRALEDWGSVLIERDGPTLRGSVLRSIDRHGRLGSSRLSGAAVTEIIRRVITTQAEGQGASPEEVEARLQGVSGHSLRSGLVTTAFASGISAEDVMRQTRHRNVQTLVRYRRHATAFVGNVSGRVGL